MSVNVLKTFLIASLVFPASVTFAANQTEYAYQNPKSRFCEIENSNGGEQILQDLDKENEEKFKRSEQIKEELNTEIALMAKVKKHLQDKENLFPSMKTKIDEEVKSSLSLLKSINKNENLDDVINKICKNFKNNDVCDNPQAATTSIRESVVKNILELVKGMYPEASKNHSFFSQALFNSDHIGIVEKSSSALATTEAIKGEIDKKGILDNITKACIHDVSSDANLDQETVNEFQKFCENESIYELENPQTKYQLAENIGKKVLKMSDRVQSLKEIYSDDEFNQIEIFKSYVAKKYLCICAKEATPEVVIQRTCYNYESHNKISAPSVFRLSGDIDNVLRNMNFTYELGSLENKCAPSINLSNAVVSSCKKFGNNPKFKKVCDIAGGEQAKLDDQAGREKRWDDLNRDYWIKRDSSAKDGFIKTKKKKTWELIGEGVAPVLATSVVPIWFTNYQIKSNVNMLTQQALAEKQYSHTIDVYNQNPWMYSYPFIYQPNYFPVYSPIGTTGTTPTGASTGYNFSGTP